MKRHLVRGGQRVHHNFLGKGDVVQVLDRAAGLIYVLWDETPPEKYNLGANPSVVLTEDLEEEGVQPNSQIAPGRPPE